MDFEYVIEEINDYEIYHWAEYGMLLLDPLKELGMPENLLALLEQIVNHYNELPEDEDLEIFPKAELIDWFKNTINKSKSWNDLEVPLRSKLLDVCRAE